MLNNLKDVENVETSIVAEIEDVDVHIGLAPPLKKIKTIKK